MYALLYNFTVENYNNNIVQNFNYKENIYKKINKNKSDSIEKMHNYITVCKLMIKKREN